MKTYLMTFSPTGTSRAIGRAILNGTGNEGAEVDMTYPAESGMLHIPSDTLAVVTVPVYGGHVAPMAAERMKNIISSGAPAVAVVVYGNRDYGTALSELGELLRGKGFKVIAGGTFVGEHSYSNDEYPIAAGRPDVDDVRQAEEFGRAIMAKLVSGCTAEVPLENIPKRRNGILPVLRFIAGVVRIRRSKSVSPGTPETDTSVCTHCGACVKVCPAGAISYGKECVTDQEKCIRCCACVKRCPSKARTFATPFSPLLSRNFSRRKTNNIIL